MAPLALLLCACLPKLWQGDFNVDTGAYSAYGLQAWRAGFDHGDWSWLWTLRGMGGDPASGGTLYFNKPPLAFWIHGLVLYLSTMGGGNATIFFARLPSVMAAGMSVWFSCRAAQVLSGRRVACIAGCVMATSIHFITYARAFSLDLWQLAGLSFMLWMVAQAVATTAASKRRSALFMSAAGLGLGAALMAKPVVALVAVPIVLVWLGLSRRFALAGMLGLTLMVALAIAGPWHVSMWMLHGEAFTSQYIGNQIIERARGTLPSNAGAEHFYYYLLEIARSGWPWLALAPVAGVAAWAATRRGTDGAREGSSRGRSLVALGACWLAIWLVLLSSFADKRPRYLSIVAPAVGWLWAPTIVAVTGSLAMVRRALSRWVLPMGLLAAVAVSVAPLKVHSEQPADWTAAIEQVRAAAAAEGANVWGASLSPMGSSRFYLALGFWPRPTVDYAKRPLAAPTMAGSILVYESDNGVWNARPGAGEAVLLENGKVIVSRLDTPPWKPVSAPHLHPADQTGP